MGCCMENIDGNDLEDCERFSCEMKWINFWDMKFYINFFWGGQDTMEFNFDLTNLKVFGHVKPNEEPYTLED